MRLNKISRLLATTLIAASCWSCTASAPDQTSSGELHGGMLGLGGHDGAVWEEWTPREAAAMSVDDELLPATLFDVWRIEDASFQQDVGDALFHLLLSFEGVDLPGESTGDGLRYLTYRLEPEIPEVTWEISFLSHVEGQSEGLVLRVAGADGAGIWLEARRPAGGSDAPTAWILRAEPAAAGVDGLTVRWELADGQWRAHASAGAGADETATVVGKSDWEPILGLLETALWEEVTAEEYLQPNFERIDDDPVDLGPGWPANLGRDIEQRALSDYVDDTVFLPRSTGEPLEGF